MVTDVVARAVINTESARQASPGSPQNCSAKRSTVIARTHPNPSQKNLEAYFSLSNLSCRESEIRSCSSAFSRARRSRSATAMIESVLESILADSTGSDSATAAMRASMSRFSEELLSGFVRCAAAIQLLLEIRLNLLVRDIHVSNPWMLLDCLRPWRVHYVGQRRQFNS